MAGVDARVGGRHSRPLGRGGPARAYLCYAIGLLVVYAGGLVAFWPPEGEQPAATLFLVLMFAPTAGALLAKVAAQGRIQWGRPGLTMLLGLVPVLAVLGAYLLAGALGWVREDPDVLWAALAGAPIAIFGAAISAVGEEIGWRGFLWPTLRQRNSFVRASLVMFVVWWLYHVPLVILGWYGSLAGLPAFTVAVAGIVLFLGVITDRSRSLWPSVVTHGAWNGLVATSFAATEGVERVPAFSGSEALLGEFGWLSAVVMACVGLGSVWWHFSRPLADGAAAPRPTLVSARANRP
ncbi:hypothetical protein GCM10023168_03280 [Fodinibacter luteus]|uniref:CAAX prenyl protease 2/Lysostaphin resistance protein A-like domain-containing protein n=1 Tax=Fodinibacter luteus TaxID=552064 RepID=A0ABP8JZ07_9MICO